MVYTDYFVEGHAADHDSVRCTRSAPTPMRSPASALRCHADQLDAAARREPRIAGSPTATNGVTTPADQATGGTVEEPKKKKKGFWSRVFGGGNKDEPKDDQNKEKKDKKPDGG